MKYKFNPSQKQVYTGKKYSDLIHKQNYTLGKQDFVQIKKIEF